MPVVLIAKGVISIAAGLGVNRIATEIIRNNTTIVTTADKVLVSAGSLAVSSMLVEATGNHVERMFESVTSRVKRNKNTVEEVVVEA